MSILRNDSMRRQLLLPVGLALGLLSPLHAAAAPAPGSLLAACALGQADFGTIKGRLVWGGDQIPPNQVLAAQGKAQKDPEICAKNQPIYSHALEIDPTTKGVAYGFAYIVRPKGANPAAVAALVAKEPKVVMDQKNCDFVPHSLALHKDQALVMKSSDPNSHNVRLTGFNNGINQVLPPNGQLEVKVVAERLPLMLKCDIHPWMSANVMVLDHPFFAVTAADGSFEIKEAPAGEQNIVVWQEEVGFVTAGLGRGMPVKVAAGAVTDVGEVKIDPAKVK